jgi:hypothetical protein
MDDWVTIIHPETGGTATVHRGALPHHYASGWQLQPPAEPPAPPPPGRDPDAPARAAKAGTKPDLSEES